MTAYEQAMVALDQITDEQIAKCARVLAAVAEMDMPSQGVSDDRYCPFCPWEELDPEPHAEDCPVTIARRIIAETDKSDA